MGFDIDNTVASFDFNGLHQATAGPDLSLINGTELFNSTWDYPSSSAGTTPMLASFDTDHALDAAFMTLSTPPDPDCTQPDWLLWSKDCSHHAPPLVKQSMKTLLRVMKTWPRILAKGFQSPPILHHTHTDPKTSLDSMRTCISISKLWASQPALLATDYICQTILHEIRTIFVSYRSLDETHLLAAFQSLLMYLIMLMYPGCNKISVALLDPGLLLCVQRMVSYVAKTGLMLTEERDNIRPSWESWVHVSAKRRAVFSLYLLRWSYAVHHGLESFACTHLGFMPAPAPKFLWQATSGKDWETLYDKWLRGWGNHPYKMREFAAIQAGPGLEPRTAVWLEDADELGILFFSIGTNMYPDMEWW